MLDGFLGHLPASWMEQVTPSAMTPMAPTSQGSHTNQRNRNVGTMVTNTNYQASLRKCWQASGHLSITQLLQAYTSEGTPTVPMMGDQPVCLSWILWGCCFNNCARANTHKQASQAILAQVHMLLDACSMPSSN